MKGSRCHDSGIGVGEVFVALDGADGVDVKVVSVSVSVFVVDCERGG